MKKIIFTLVFSMGIGLVAWSQQQSQYTQFMYNQLTVNPAYAGSRGMGSLMALYRNQWLGFEGSPQTRLVSFNTPIMKNRVGFGLTINNSTIGVLNSLYATMAYAYHIPFNDKTSLRLGLQGSIRQLGLDFSDPSVLINQDGDPSILENQLANVVNGNFGVGLYLTADQFYFGVSVPYLYPNEIGFNSDPNILTIAEEKPHFYAIAGSMLKLNESIHIRPSILAKYVENAPFDLDINLSFVYKLLLTAGVSYRLGGNGNGESIDFMALYQYNTIAFGLAYDVTLSDLANHTSGSFEALVRFDFVKEREDMANPRFFY